MLILLPVYDPIDEMIYYYYPTWKRRANDFRYIGHWGKVD